MASRGADAHDFPRARLTSARGYFFTLSGIRRGAPLLEGVDHHPDEYVEAARVPLVLEPPDWRLDHIVELGKEVSRARVDADFPGDFVFDPELRPGREAVARLDPDLAARAEERSVLIVQF